MHILTESAGKVRRKEGSLNIYKKKMCLIIFLIYEIIIFLITLIRASITQLTFDEADTCGTYCKETIFTWPGIKETFSSSIANNHLLNTYLITLFQMIFNEKYSEFLIRLPMILFLAVFLVMVYFMLQKEYISIPVAVFLTSNYYVAEFYGLARGYAMANALVFGACASYIAWGKREYKDDRYLVLCSLFLAAAISANTVVLLLIPSFGIMWLIRLLQERKLLLVLKKYVIYLVIYAIFMGIMFKYHMNVTQISFLYTGEGKSFFECFFVSYGYMFTHQHALIAGAAFLSVVVLVTVFCVWFRNIYECDFLIMFWILLAVFGLAQFLFRRGYATGRELIPFYPLVVFAMWNGMEKTVAGWQRVCGESNIMRMLPKALSFVICVLLILNFMRKIDVDSTSEWYDNYGRRENVIKQFMLTDGDWTQMEDFGAEEDWFYLYKLHDICFGESNEE